MSKNPPQISVVLPVFNGEMYLEEALESVLFQTFGDLELMVIDDGSDNAKAIKDIVQRYSKSDGRISLMRQENGGCASALNLGLAHAKGMYFSWLSHDDVMSIDRLKKCMEIAQNKNEDVFVFSDYNIIDADGNIAKTVEIHQKLGETWRVDYRMPLMLSLINGCTVFTRVSSLKKAGLFNTALPTTQDYAMWQKLMKEKNVFHLEISTIYSRIHKNQTSLLRRKEHTTEADNWYLLAMKEILADKNQKLKPLEWLCIFQEHIEKSEYNKSKAFIKQSLDQIEVSSAETASLYQELKLRILYE